MTTTEKKLISITLSERAPVKVDPEQWPLVAMADRHDGEVRCQANNEYAIKVREHADGRRIVYGWHRAGDGGQHRGFRDTYGGFIVEPSNAFRENPTGDSPAVTRAPDEAETVRAIRRVSGMIDDDQLGNACIADLPATEL